MKTLLVSFIAISSGFLGFGCKPRSTNKNSLRDFYDNRAQAAYWSVGEKGSPNEYYCRGVCRQESNVNERTSPEQLREMCSQSLRFIKPEVLKAASLDGFVEVIADSKSISVGDDLDDALLQKLKDVFVNQQSQDPNFRKELDANQVASLTVTENPESTRAAEEICLGRSLGPKMKFRVISTANGSQTISNSTPLPQSNEAPNSKPQRQSTGAKQSYAKCSTSYNFAFKGRESDLGRNPELYQGLVKGPIIYTLNTYALDIEKEPLKVSQTRMESIKTELLKLKGTDFSQLTGNVYRDHYKTVLQNKVKKGSLDRRFSSLASKKKIQIIQMASHIA